jgi:hypothetical protein
MILSRRVDSEPEKIMSTKTTTHIQEALCFQDVIQIDISIQSAFCALVHIFCKLASNPSNGHAETRLWYGNGTQSLRERDEDQGFQAMVLHGLGTLEAYDFIP